MSATLGDVTALAEDLSRRNGRETAVVDRRRAAGAAELHLVDRDPRRHARRAGRRPTRRRSYVVHFTQAAAVEHATSLLRGTKAGSPAPVRDRQGGDRGPDGDGPVRCGVRQDPLEAAARRHRRPPRRDAAEVPPRRRAAGAGRPADGHLRHRHPRRRHQRPDPDRAVQRARQVRRQPAAGAQGPRVPARSPAARAGPASTPPATSSCRRPSTSSTTRRPRRRRRPAPTRGRRRSSGSRRRAPSCGTSRPSTSWSPASPSRSTSRMRVDNAMLVNVLAREEDAFPVMRRLLTDNHEDRRQQVRLVRRALRLTRVPGPLRHRHPARRAATSTAAATC